MKFILTMLTHKEQVIQKLVLKSKKDKNLKEELDPQTKSIEIHGKEYNKSIFHINTQQFSTRVQYYFIDSNNHIIKSRYFYLNPIRDENPRPFRVVLFGDIQLQESLGILESFMMFLVRKIGKPNMILCMGDLVHKFDDPELWHVFFRMMRKILPNTPFYTTPGNHCGGEDAGETLAKYFSRPLERWNYNFVMNKSLFITMNSLTLRGAEGKKQLDWLNEELHKYSKKVPFTIFWTHYPYIGPGYASGGKVTDYEIYVKENLHPILDDNKIDLAFFGHKHSYIREGNKIVTASIHGVRKYPEIWTEEKKLKNRHHFCTLDILNDEITMKAIDWFGRIMDQLYIKKNHKLEELS